MTASTLPNDVKPCSMDGCNATMRRTTRFDRSFDGMTDGMKGQWVDFWECDNHRAHTVLSGPARGGKAP